MNIWEDRAKKVLEAREALFVRIDKARELKDKGYNNLYIARQLGINESSVRVLLKGANRR